MTSKFLLVISFISVRYQYHQFGTTLSFFVSLHGIVVIDFSRIHLQNGGVRKGLEKFFFVPIGLCHYFDSQILSFGLSAFYSSRAIEHFQNDWKKCPS